jgi:anti-sigma B factor antagonist
VDDGQKAGFEVSDHPAPADGVTVLYDDGGTRVELAGEVDLAVNSDLGQAADLVIDRGLPITVDLSQVDFIDSIGMAFLARLTAADHQAGRRMTVVGAGTGVRQLMTVSGLSDLVDFTDI